MSYVWKRMAHSVDNCVTWSLIIFSVENIKKAVNWWMYLLISSKQWKCIRVINMICKPNKNSTGVCESIWKTPKNKFEVSLQPCSLLKHWIFNQLELQPWAHGPVGPVILTRVAVTVWFGGGGPWRCDGCRRWHGQARAAAQQYLQAAVLLFAEHLKKANCTVAHTLPDPVVVIGRQPPIVSQLS